MNIVTPFIVSTPIQKSDKICSVWEAVHQNKRQNFDRAGWAKKASSPSAAKKQKQNIVVPANPKRWWDPHFKFQVTTCTQFIACDGLRV